MKARARSRSRPGRAEAPRAAAPSSAARGPDGLVPIGRLAREAGVSTRTVRYYEEIGLLRTARRFAGGRRVFDGDALVRLRFIGRLKRLGFSLDEVAELNAVFELQRSTRAMLNVLDGKLARHLAALDEQMLELGRLRQDLLSYHMHIRRRLHVLPAIEASQKPSGGD